MPTMQEYARRMRRETKLHAAWPPDLALGLGAFGPMDKAIFEPIGELEADEMAALDTTASANDFAYDIQINSERRLNADLKAVAEAGVANGKALLEIGFSSEQGFLFAAPRTRNRRFSNFASLGRLLTERLERGDWNLAHHIVVQVTTADRATVILSANKVGRVAFEVDGKAPVDADLVASLDGKAGLVTMSGVGMRFIGGGPVTPLFRLAQLRRRWIGQPEVKYRDAVDEASEVHPVNEDFELALYEREDVEGAA